MMIVVFFEIADKNKKWSLFGVWMDGFSACDDAIWVQARGRASTSEALKISPHGSWTHICHTGTRQPNVHW